MDPESNGHGDQRSPSARDARPRFGVARDVSEMAAARVLRGGEQMARLESRIRDFHRNLSAFDAAEASVNEISRQSDPTNPAKPKLESVAEGESLLARAGSEARAAADKIQQDAEHRASQLREDATREAQEIRKGAEEEMQELWQALEQEVGVIQEAISQRVAGLAGRMDAVAREADAVRAEAHEEADQIRLRAAEDAERMLAAASAEAEARLTITRTAERAPGDRIAEQIRDATEAVTTRFTRGGEDTADARYGFRDPVVPDAVKDVLDRLTATVSLVERSLTGLSDLLAETLGTERSG